MSLFYFWTDGFKLRRFHCTLSEAAKYDKANRKANLKKERDCMKNKVIWWVVLVVGMIPLVFPFLNFAYEMLISSSWKLGEWLLLWSFVYWPTYIVGVILIILSVCKLRK